MATVKLDANLTDVSKDLYSLLFTTGYAVSYKPVVQELHAKIDRRFRLEFNMYMSTLAMQNENLFWHLYGNGHLGESSYRLFNTQMKGEGTDEVQIILKYLPDTSQVVVNEKLVENPGKTGRTVSGRKYGRSKTYRNHRFVSKAAVIDQGLTVKITPKTKEGYLAFYSKREGKVMFLKGAIIHYSGKPTFKLGENSFINFSKMFGEKIAVEVFNNNAKLAKQAPKFTAMKQPATFEQVKAACKKVAWMGGQRVI